MNSVKIKHNKFQNQYKFFGWAMASRLNLAWLHGCLPPDDAHNDAHFTID